MIGIPANNAVGNQAYQILSLHDLLFGCYVNFSLAIKYL